MVGIKSNTNTHAQVDFSIAEVKGCLKRPGNAPANMFGTDDTAVGIGEQYTKFVTAQAGQSIRFTVDLLFQAIGNLNKNVIAYLVTEGIVNLFKVV